MFVQCTDPKDISELESLKPTVCTLAGLADLQLGADAAAGSVKGEQVDLSDKCKLVIDFAA